MGVIHKIKSSFAARFSLYLALVVNVVFVIILTTFYIKSANTLTDVVEDRVTRLLEISNLEIDKVLSQAMRIPDNLKNLLLDYPLIPDSLYSLTREVVANNDIVYGSAIALEPYYFPEKGRYFSPYAKAVGDSIVSSQLGNRDYDYFSMDWYIIPKLLNQSYWTEPYFEEGVTMTTYSSPMYDHKGNFIGVFTIDLELEWLSDVMNANKPYPNSYEFMIGRGGTYILHSNKDYILNASVFSVSLETENPDIYEIGQDMVDGNKGTRTLKLNGVKHYVIYAPIPQIKWSSAFVCPTNEVFADLHQTRNLFIMLGILCLVITFVSCYYIIKRLLRPILQFAASANEIASGNLDSQLPAIHSQDEMKDLHDAFENMQNDLKNYITSLTETTSAKEKIESELHIARTIQMGMIPKIFPPYPERDDVDIYAMLQPAKEVGGDLYDFYINDNKLYFAIGDVSGKGVPASLLMAVTRSLFRTISSHFADVQKITDSINNAVSENNESFMFVTLFVGILDLNTGALSYCNAGHNAPVILTKDKEPFVMPVIPNLPIGVFQGFNFQQQEAIIPPGASIFLCTDGLNEAENINAELYGDDRMLNALSKMGNYSAQLVVERMHQDVNKHVGEAAQSDDLTMLVIGYKTRIDLDRTLSLKNDMSQIEKLEPFFEALQEELGLSVELGMQLNLAIEEVIANCIMYAYCGEVDKDIFLKARMENRNLIFTVVDYGFPFDPTTKVDPDITLSAEDRPIGGLGVFLVKKIMDKVDYSRIDNANILIMTKKI